MKILLADDQADFRSSLADLLSRVPGVEIVGEASNGKEAESLAMHLRPDVTLMDIRMPVLDGIAATAAIRQAWKDACILVLTTFDEDSLIEAAMRAGATGYLLKGTPLDDLIAILHLARRGYTAIGRGSVRERQVPAEDEVSKRAALLSERETEVWALIGQGHTNRDIADRLHLTKGTVKNYVTALLGTLQVRHRTEAALLWRHAQGRRGISNST